MPPRRARANSTASTSSQPARRSSRAPPTPVKKAVATPTKKPTKRARSVSVAPVEEDDEEEAADEEGEPVENGSSRKRKAASPSPSKPKTKKAAPVPRVRPPRVPHVGMNLIPQLFKPQLPHGSKWKFETTPNPSDVHIAFVFGNGDMGQHGLGIEDDVLCEIKRPRLHKGFEELIAGGGAWAKGIADVECGGMHTLALDSDHKVYSWGINDNAALGRITVNHPSGTQSEILESQPTVVQDLVNTNFKTVSLAAGDSHSIAISELGEVRCWGSFRSSEGLLGFDANTLTQLTPVALPNLSRHTIVQVASGDDHFVALSSAGTILTCGNGEQNQLGRKIIARHKENGLTPTSLALRNIVLVGSGSYHSFAVNDKGQVFGWGLNSFRQLGIPEEDGGWEESFSVPTVIEALSPSQHDGAKVVQIVGGTHHSLFLFENGEVWGCGRCDGNEIGLEDDHPEMKAIKERDAEARQLRVVREAEEKEKLKKEVDEDGNPLSADKIDLKAAENAAQSIPLPNPYIPLPNKISFPLAGGVEPKIVSIGVGSRANFATSNEGNIFSWGFSNTSQLGQGNEDSIETPTMIVNKAVTGVKILKVASGGQHSFALGVRGPNAIESDYY